VANTELNNKWKEGYRQYKQSREERFFKDFVGAWQFPMDFLPSSNPSNSVLELFAFGWNQQKEINCDPRYGRKTSDECQIEARVRMDLNFE
jgi:hypothetical protein